jgi:preprotein translocase subunit SecA
MLMSADDLNKMELTQKQFNTSIERAQKQMEGWHFSTRKHLFDYDSVVDKQRQQVYGKRELMLQALDAVEKAQSE